MPSKEKNTAPADVDDTASSTSADPREELSDVLAIGTADLEPWPMRFRGVEFDLKRHYTADEVWEISDLMRKPLTEEYSEHHKNRDVLKAITESGDIDAILSIMEDRSTAEFARFFRQLYVRAGITNAQGEFLAF